MSAFFKSCLIMLLFLNSACLYAQENLLTSNDSIQTKELGEIVVTATRNQKLISALPMPVKLISRQQIQQMGALRLNDVLVEQTGLFIVNDHGQGIQIQGFSPEYTLILIDGEPLVGRTAGTLELNRITVGNIKQIEIVKGPSSSLYGSEALAGVINIITEKPEGAKANFSARYGSNNTSDLSGDLSYKYKKVGIYVFADRYQTNGYDLSPQTFGKSIDPFSNYTLSTKLIYDFSTATQLSFSGRYFNENQSSAFDTGSGGQQEIISGRGKVSDWNINPVLTHHFNKQLKTILRFYSTHYSTNSRFEYPDGQTYDESYFKQSFDRPEIIGEYSFNKTSILTLGTGYIRETVEATRYDNKKRFSTYYAFFQYECKPFKNLSFIMGGRYDAHSAYASQFSPKASAQYDLFHWLALRGSTGVGFKAPDFRQLYLNFTNSIAGYSVFGSQELVSQLANLQAQNQIAEVLADPSIFGNIRPESSLAYSFGFKIKPLSTFTSNINFFRNDINDLIETQIVARKTNGQNVFSYMNISKVFTQGIEWDAHYQIAKSISFSAGYQYLEAKDKFILSAIKGGEVFSRDPQTKLTARVKTSDYGGLFNRSHHSANFKVFYNNTSRRFSANIRGIYRGRYGFGDKNNNSILDSDEEYVKGYMIWNLTLGKSILKDLIKIQVGMDNVFGYTDPTYIANLAGRLIYANLSFSLSRSN